MQPSTRGRNQFQSRHQSLHITMPPKQRSTPAKKSSKKTADDAGPAAADPPADDDVIPAKKAKKPQCYNKKGEPRYNMPTP